MPRSNAPSANAGLAMLDPSPGCAWTKAVISYTCVTQETGRKTEQQQMLAVDVTPSVDGGHPPIDGDPGAVWPIVFCDLGQRERALVGATAITPLLCTLVRDVRQCLMLGWRSGRARVAERWGLLHAIKALLLCETAATPEEAQLMYTQPPEDLQTTSTSEQSLCQTSEFVIVTAASVIEFQ